MSSIPLCYEACPLLTLRGRWATDVLAETGPLRIHIRTEQPVCSARPWLHIYQDTIADACGSLAYAACMFYTDEPTFLPVNTRRPANVFWSPEEEAALRQGYADGLTLLAISRLPAIRRTRASVKNTVRRMLKSGKLQPRAHYKQR